MISSSPASTLGDSALGRESPAASDSAAGSASGPPAPLSAATSAPGSEHGDLPWLPPLAGCKGRPLDLKGIPASAAVVAGSWKSADDSAAALEAQGSGRGQGCAEELAHPEDWEEDYGADARRALWRRHEVLAAVWILLALLAAAVVNVGVGVVNSQRDSRAPVAAAGGTAATLTPPLPPQLPPPPPRHRKRRRPAPPLPPAPPRPPAPPPEFCDTAPGNLARWRFSNVTAVFPTKQEHYAANLIEKRGLDFGLRYPAYYNGVVQRFCLLTIEAVYTCMVEDNPCNYSPEVALRYCQTACPNNNNSCMGIANLAGHPLLPRVCGLFARSRPACINIGYTVRKQRQMRAFYKLNICQAPPGPRPPPRPPLPPAQPPPPRPAPVLYEYY